MRNATAKFLLTVFLLGASSGAFAHPSHNVSGFAAGIIHPLSGLDHLLAMVAVGLWAAQGNTKKRGGQRMAAARHLHHHARGRCGDRDAVANAAADRVGHRGLGAGTGFAGRTVKAASANCQRGNHCAVRTSARLRART